MGSEIDELQVYLLESIRNLQRVKSQVLEQKGPDGLVAVTKFLTRLKTLEEIYGKLVLLKSAQGYGAWHKSEADSTNEHYIKVGSA